MLLISARCGLQTFVETGTFEGATARWAARHFERVVTIERSPVLHERAAAAGADTTNVDFVLGDSKAVLPGLVESLGGPALFWLDGHWSGGDTAGAGDECPLVDELRAIQASPRENALFIDDARLFAAPPPPPHDPEQWPALDDVILALQTPERRYSVAVVDDVIVAVPPAAKPELVAYARMAAVPPPLGGLPALMGRLAGRQR